MVILYRAKIAVASSAKRAVTSSPQELMDFALPRMMEAAADGPNPKAQNRVFTEAEGWDLAARHAK